MSDESDERRDRIHALLQEMGFPGQDGSLLTGWAIVTTWAAPDGERFIAKAHAAETADWTADGMHHQALYGTWPRDE